MPPHSRVLGKLIINLFVPAELNPLNVKDCECGRRVRCRDSEYGFPIAHAQKARTFIVYQMGDLVKAVISLSRYAGMLVRCISIRFSPSFRFNGLYVHPKYIKRLQFADGCKYPLGGFATALIPLSPYGDRSLRGVLW